MESSTPVKPNPPLRRRNSIATSVVVPSKLSLPFKPHLHSSFPPAISASSSLSRSFPTTDVELISIKPISSYTSIKDLLPSAACVHFPTGSAATSSACEISIRNRLVKQAAWAYLQPMSTSPDTVGRSFFQRVWERISGGDLLRNNPLAALFRFLDQHIVRALTRFFGRFLRAVRIRSFR